jgi:AcrR family transcriptional regulator
MPSKRAAERRPGAAGLKTANVRTRLNADVRSKMIVDVAFKAIAKGGFEGLRTREIAKLVGINSATLHHYFPTKEDLVESVANQLEGRFRAEKTSPVERERAVDALHRQLKDAIFYYAERPEMLAVYREFVGRAPRDPMIKKLVQRLHARWQADIVEALNKGRHDGSFRADLDSKAAAGVVLSTVWGLIAHIFTSKDDFTAGFHELLKWLAPGQKITSQTKTC